MALHARSIPGTKHVIDHVVVGPAGVFTLDSQRLDRRLPLRAMGGMLYHGRRAWRSGSTMPCTRSKHAAKLIAAELGQRVRVRPVMVLYGPSISWVIMKFKGVDVFDGSRVGTYLPPPDQGRRQAPAQRQPDRDGAGRRRQGAAAARVRPSPAACPAPASL